MSGEGTVHVVGAGLAGLGAAVALIKAGRRVVVHEAAGHAGGRCRSFDDATLGRRIDNGNHLILSGNRSARGFLDDIGAADQVSGPREAVFPFMDLRTGAAWRVAVGRGRLPLWMFKAENRPPATGSWDMLRGLGLLRASADQTVAQCLGSSRAFPTFWEPLALAVLNTAAEEGAAQLLGRVMAETVGHGRRACRPLIARTGLGDAFVSPAVNHLRSHGAEVRFKARLRSIDFDERGVTGLAFGDARVGLASGDCVVLAVPPWVAIDLVPGLVAPTDHRPIVNAHFRLPAGAVAVPFLGLVGGTSQWLFVRDDFASVTISAAVREVEEDAEYLARRMWPEVAAATGMPVDFQDNPPPHRIVKEKRATFAQTPEQVRRRPPARTRWQNLFLAGDWVDNGLPATIEGSLRSGSLAARYADIPQGRP